MQGAQLRPLSIGELLDRAVTISVRAFIPLAILVSISAVPLQIFDRIMWPSHFDTYADVVRVFTTWLPGTGASRGPHAPLMWLFLLIGSVLSLFTWSAFIAIANAELASTRETWSHALALGVRLLPSQVLVTLAFIGIAFGIPIWILIFVTGALGPIVHGLTFILILLAGYSWLLMAWNLSTIALVLEGLTLRGAIRAGWRRTFTRPTAWRSYLVGVLAFGLTTQGTLPFAAIGALLAAVSHVGGLYDAVLVLGTIVLTVFTNVLIVVYAADVRARREGTDLLASRLDEPAAAT
jgi:hypothetical protein